MKIPWDVYEAALLIETYIAVRRGKVQRKDAVKDLSKTLRAYGRSKGFEIDEIYRNENGINMRLYEIEHLFNDGQSGLKNTSRLFISMVELFRNDWDGFNRILEKAKGFKSRNRSEKQTFSEFPKKIEVPAPAIKTTEVTQTVEEIKKTNSRTIEEAVVMILEKAAEPMTSEEIYNKIVEEDLYIFGAQNPQHVVDTIIKRACKESNFSIKREKSLFGSVLNKEGKNSYFLLSRENELFPPVESETKEEDAKPDYLRTEADEILYSKYAVIFKRIYTVMKTFGSVIVSDSDVQEKIGKIGRLSTVRYILDHAGWSEQVEGKYRYSSVPVEHILDESNDTDQAFVNNTIEKKDDVPTISENHTVLDLNGIGDLSFTKPVKLKLLGFEENIFSSWAALYTRVLGILRDRYPDIITNGIYLSHSRTPDILNHPTIMRSPKSIGDDLYVETNQDSKGLVSRLAQALKLCHIDLDEIKIEYIYNKTTKQSQSRKNIDTELKTTHIQKENYLKADIVKDASVNYDAANIINFNEVGDLSYTKPIRLKFFDDEEIGFSGWATLYARIMFNLRERYPQIINKGLYLHNSKAPDISENPDLMRTPKPIGTDLYIETNQDSKGIVYRIAHALRLCNVDLSAVKIQYIRTKNTEPDRTQGKSEKGETNQTITDIGNFQQNDKILSFIKDARNGVTIKEIKSRFPGAKQWQINSAVEEKSIALINKQYYHRQNIENYEDAAEIILTALKKQFKLNNGYTSGKMLYHEVRSRLDDFFFYNGKFESQAEIYDLARYIFEKENYKAHAFVFFDNKHIWESEPSYPKNYLGILSNWARQQNGVMTRDEMLERLGDMGSTSATATYSFLMLDSNQKEKVFLMYDVYCHVLTETVQIDEEFLNCVKGRLEELFENDDYLSFDDIDEYFYSTLPVLPKGVIWSVHMLKSILSFYDVGFFTVPSTKNSDIKMPDAAIIRKNSNHQTFSDVVWAEINKDFDLPREFSAAEFREILLNRGFIHGSEKLTNVHTTVEDDLRFFWTENNKKVTVSSK